MKEKKRLLLSIGLVLILVLMIVGISYAAFKFVGEGSQPNTITTGVITMKYTETTNTISMNNALPTTDATGKVRLTEGEYFDFTLSGTIKGSENINWEIAAEDVTTATRKIDGKYIKLYLTSLDENNNETEVMAPTVYTTESTENTYTGRAANVMSLAKGTTSTSFSTKYRLRMYVDESYNPQGDGGNLAFSIKINAYGKTGDKVLTLTQKVLADNELQEEKAHMFNYTSNGLTSGSTTPDSNYVTTGLYSTEDEDGTSYYYRGNIVNNNVQFGEYQEDYYVYKYNNQYFQSLETCQNSISSCSESNTTKVKLASKGDKMYWKIVRINGDGSARLIYNGTNPTATYDANDLSTWPYIGLTYWGEGDSSLENNGYENSYVKKDTISWYSNTLENSAFDSKVSTTVFCSDTSGLKLSSEYGFTSGPSTIFSSGNRLAQSFNNFAKDNSPSLICPATSEKVGGSYNLKIGLITGDELTFAGGLYSVASNNYLNTNGNYNYWSMTPLFYSNNMYFNLVMNNNLKEGVLNTGGQQISALRPVINVSGSVTENVDGTVDNPYIIK